jgi:uncharacterized OsmC-like protein
MTTGGLREYLVQKTAAMRGAAALLGSGEDARQAITAECTASTLDGARRIRIRGFELVSDSGPSFGGQDLGPSSPELLLGVLASCLTHTYLIGAAMRGVSLDAVEVRVDADNNDARFLELKTADPDVPFNIRATVRIESPAAEEELADLDRYVDASCPLTKLVRLPQSMEIRRERAQRK